MNNIYPEYLTKLINLSLKDFVDRVEVVTGKLANPAYEPARILQKNPELATVPVKQCESWFTENHSSISSREGRIRYYSWLRLAIQAFESEEPRKYDEWKKEADYLMQKLKELKQLIDLIDNITSSFIRATGQGQKELIKKTPSAHFCKRYNVLLRQSRQLISEIGEEIGSGLWPPELPGVDNLRDEQPVPSTNYMEIQIYYGQIRGLISEPRNRLEKLSHIIP